MVVFLTVNVNGLRDPNKRMSFLQWLSHLSADFVCLQETHISSCTEAASWFSPYGFLVVASPGTVHSRGSVILYRSAFTLTKSVFDANGRFVLCYFQPDGVSFGVACVYAPNRNPDRDDFFQYCVDQVDPSVPTAHSHLRGL